MTQFSSEEMLSRCVAWIQDKKARDIVSLHLSGLTLIADYFLIVTAANTRQAQAICDAVEEGLAEAGQPLLRIEGYQDARWILLDLGAVVVHVFQEEERAYFDLERLWKDAEKISYSGEF